MSTRSDFNIKISEAFFNIPDVSDINTQRFIINDSSWFGQVFVSKSNELQKIFFICDDTEGLEINIHKALIEIVNGQQIFTPGQILVSIIHEVDNLSPFVTINTNEENPVAKWNYPNWLATPQIDEAESYYIAVFKTTTNKTPNIYWTLDYRQPIFPQIIGWNGESWSNNNIETFASGNSQVGAICFGHVGNDLRDSVLDSGSLIIGGRDSARRGYPIYVFIENISSQNDKIIVDFSMLPPEASEEGSNQETNQAMMKWYRFEPTTLPTSSILGLIGSDIKSELDSSNNFVIYTQPDKLSPLAESFLPESIFNLYSNPLGFVPLYGSYGVDFGGLSDSTNRFGLDYWTNFLKERKLVLDNGKRKASDSQNPDYIDLSLEDPDGEIDILKNLILTSDALDGASSEKSLIRGFSKGVFYKDKYVFFSKKYVVPTIAPASDPAYPGRLLALISDSDFTNFNKKIVTFADSIPTTLGSDAYIVGVHDIIRRNINGEDTLVFIFQTKANSFVDHSWFDVGYYNGDWSESIISIQLIKTESSGGSPLSDGTLGFFLPDDEGYVDAKFLAKFIEPRNSKFFYFTADGPVLGLAIWKISDDDILSASYEAKILDINNSSDKTGIIDTDDVSIDSILYDGNTTYLGVIVDGSGINFARIYRTDDFITFEQLLGGDTLEPPSWFNGFSSVIVNNKVSFMHKVGNILHVWTSPAYCQPTATPFHIAINTITRDIQLLRKFPIDDIGDSDYSDDPTISDLDIFKRSKYIRCIDGGNVVGNKIYIYGADDIGYYSLFTTLSNTYSTRWLVYDDRIINNYINFTNIVGKGLYNGKTISEFGYDDGSSVFKNYPALNPDLSTNSTNPRVSVYCGVVNVAVTEDEGIDGTNKNVPDSLFSYGGINYLVTRNYESNFDLFKTYGVKELPENWGKSFKDSSGNPSDIENYNFIDIDNANYEKVVAGSKETLRYISRRSVPLFINGVVLFSEIKRNDINPDFSETNSAFPRRSILVLKRSLKKPQNISAIYKFRYIGDENNINKLLDVATSETALTIKGAQTLEDLFSNPDFIEPIPLSYDLSVDKNKLYIINKNFPTDINSNFFRLESNELLNSVDVEIVNIQLKNLGLFDVDPSGTEQDIKSVAINGLLKNDISNPENIVNHGVELSPNGEIIIDFIKPTYINEISFDASYLSNDVITNERTEFEFSAIFSIEKRNTGDNIIGPTDWSLLIDNIPFGTFSNKKNIKADNIGTYISKLKLKVISGYSFKIDNFKIKGFNIDLDNIIVVGSIKSPESIFFDDVSGLLEFTKFLNKSSSFAIFESNNCSLDIDLGTAYPISRIAMNVAGEGETSSRTIVVETWDGTTLSEGNPVYENVFTGPSPNYEFSIVRWNPREMDRSRNVEVEFLDSAAPYSPSGILTDANVGDLFLDYNNISNNSGLLSRSGLAGWSFKPSLFNDRSLTVISSESRFETGSDVDYIDENTDGLIVVNCQMDEDGPFATEINGNSLGLLENKISIDFAVKNVKNIRITLRNQNNGDSGLRMNGLRLFAPIKDSTGLAISPVSTAQWDIRFDFTVSSE